MYILVQYITPISNYKFTTNERYFLAFYNSTSKNQYITKINIPDIDNINKKVRGYTIKKALKLTPDAYYRINLFAQNGPHLRLIFTGSVDFGKTKLAENYLVATKLSENIVSTTTNSLLDSRFFSNTANANNSTLLFLKLTRKPHVPIIKPIVLPVNNQFTYNRYFKNYVLGNNDTNNTDNNILFYDPFGNNTIIAPTNGLLRSFKINDSTLLNLHDTEVPLKKLVSKFYELQNGSGYVILSQPNKIFTPYPGYLKEIGTTKDVLTLKFEQEYFLPDPVSERDLLSVVNGNYTNPTPGVGAATREYPYLLDVQPKTYLIYYLILIHPPIITNKYIKQAFCAINSEGIFRIKPTWLQQGSEIGTFTTDNNYAIVLSNRPIQFAADIKYYNNAPSTLIKSKDIVGIIE
jgi:hypothetical protein